MPVVAIVATLERDEAHNTIHHWWLTLGQKVSYI